LSEKPSYINIRGKLLDLSIPRVMGIINVTPDSFYKGSRVAGEKEILETAVRMIEEGADILDVGGYSSRPGASVVSSTEEEERVLNAISLINKKLPEAIISIDTFRSEIALKAVSGCGAQIINDISGGEADKDMFQVVAKLNVPYIIMHMQGTPETMQDNPVYDDIVADILQWFSKKIVMLHSMGVKDIILDPGFGFGKKANHNFELLQHLEDFKITGLPLLVGVSRKSMIWKTLGITVDEALNGTSVLNAVALLKGADILRVHDVKEAVETIRLMEQLKSAGKETR
jgi:dihydropteroate synthase